MLIRTVAPAANGLNVGFSLSGGSMGVQTVDYDDGSVVSGSYSSTVAIGITNLRPVETIVQAGTTFVRTTTGFVAYGSTTTWQKPTYYSSVAVCANIVFVMDATAQELSALDASSGTLLSSVSAPVPCNLTCDPEAGNVLCMTPSGLFQVTYPFGPSKLLMSTTGANSVPSVSASSGRIFVATPANIVALSSAVTSCANGPPCTVWKRGVTFTSSASTQLALDDTQNLLFAFVQPTSSSSTSSTSSAGSQLWSIDATTGGMLHSVAIGVGSITVNPTAGVVAVTQRGDSVVFFSYAADGSMEYQYTSYLAPNSVMAKTVASQAGYSITQTTSSGSTVVFAEDFTALPNLSQKSPLAPPSAHGLAGWAIALIVIACSLVCCCVIFCCVQKRKSNTTYKAMLAEGIPVGIVTGNHL